MVQISSRAYQMAKLAAGLLGEAVEPPIAGADESGGPVMVTINKEAYRAARLVASITSQPWAAVVERMIVAHAEHVIGRDFDHRVGAVDQIAAECLLNAATGRV